ncbi:hypothetical protein HDK77DRAFT_181687 [Phyllosticta capitalensis]|uniref:Uncharacterized protein n=1 Tax=Phyllosticta capitalensis TaxID=121624 RepID=A0ABR1YV83_9PEZI
MGFPPSARRRYRASGLIRFASPRVTCPPFSSPLVILLDLASSGSLGLACFLLVCLPCCSDDTTNPGIGFFYSESHSSHPTHLPAHRSSQAFAVALSLLLSESLSVTPTHLCSLYILPEGSMMPLCSALTRVMVPLPICSLALAVTAIPPRRRRLVGYLVFCFQAG